MDVAVVPKPALRRSSRAFPPSLLGRGLPERLRSTTLALIGVVAAACLCMVGLTLQDGLPLASSGPIHEPVESAVGPARALTEPRPEPPRAGSGGSARSVPEGPARVSPPIATDELAPAATPPAADPVVRPPADSKQGDGSSRPERPASTVPVRSSPAPAAAPAPTAESVATPSREPPEPAPDEPAEEPAADPGNGHAYGRGGNGPEGAGPPGLAKR